jgi:hypothetical protein
MKNGLIGCFALAVMMAVTAAAAAADDFGIPSYPGARSDAETKELCSQPDMGIIKERAEQAGLKTAKKCYRTSDPFAKVLGFYKNQKGFQGGVTVDEQDVKSAMYCKGICNEVSVGTSVAISAPWFVPSSMKMNNDLLIVIIDRKK